VKREGARLAHRAGMDAGSPVDYYEALQISVNAEPETVHRVYRLFAQRFHPDNKETGSESRFRIVTEAYRVLSDPKLRAQYDVTHERQQKERWRLVEQGADADNDFASERAVRVTVLQVLYTKRRLEPHEPGIFLIDMEKLTGRPREHLEFTIWYLVQKKLIQRADNSLLVITADGVEYLESQEQQSIQPARRLHAVNE
jgi:curved DNA-binding protein CbpA